jgi:hypothetical protein
MNILHVLSGDFVTGAETSTSALINRQARAGHRVFVAAGKFSHAVEAKFFAVPIYNRSFFQRFLNILSLLRIIRSERIDLVHAHSRAASWVCYWACLMTKTAYLSTLHGRQHLHFSNRHFNSYGPQCVCVCENIRDQMLEGTNVFKPDQLKVIRNGLEL